MPMVPEKELPKKIYELAEQHIPFDIKNMLIDYKVTEQAEIEKSEEPLSKREYYIQEALMEVLLVAISKEIVSDRLDILTEAGLNAVIVDVDIFASINALKLIRNLPATGLVVLLDLANPVSRINVLSNGNFLFLQDAPVVTDFQSCGDVPPAGAIVEREERTGPLRFRRGRLVRKYRHGSAKKSDAEQSNHHDSSVETHVVPSLLVGSNGCRFVRKGGKISKRQQEPVNSSRTDYWPAGATVTTNRLGLWRKDRSAHGDSDPWRGCRIAAFRECNGRSADSRACQNACSCRGGGRRHQWQQATVDRLGHWCWPVPAVSWYRRRRSAACRSHIHPPDVPGEPTATAISPGAIDCTALMPAPRHQTQKAARSTAACRNPPKPACAAGPV